MFGSWFGLGSVLCYYTFYLLLLCYITSQEEITDGETCAEKRTGKNGVCIPFPKCDYAKKLLISGHIPQSCNGFIGFFPLVCCPRNDTRTTRSKADIQCSKYYPQKDKTLFVFNGIQSLAKEFPHMAVLGYGENEDNIAWACGGTLISEQFVLTAGHCISSRELGKVKFIRLGDLDLTNTTDDAKPQNFTVLKTFVHPGYKPPSHYNDIALIKLNRPAVFDLYVKPACLHQEREVNQSANLSATGWGKVDFAGESSSHLLKVNLNQIPHKKCVESYKGTSSRKLANGIIDKSQICAGHPEGGDTCPGDSGGPLQYRDGRVPTTFYRVVGVTSFGKACGIANSVGVYTRVSNYISWMEQIIWPDEN